MQHDLTISASGAGAWTDLTLQGVRLARWQRLALVPALDPRAAPTVGVLGTLGDGTPVFMTTGWDTLLWAVAELTTQRRGSAARQERTV